ncbi:MAG: HAD-IIIC family phosphatase [Candidatus Omnitrophica bacterium]|nr:HAD-IIIC family phosphatase [Candidatus Omnitrophota bacterium]
MRALIKRDIVKALKAIITDDDSVIVMHSNIFSFGQMDNIVPEIMAAIFKTLKPFQTLLMPTFTTSYCKSFWYHWKETPSETGVLSEYFRSLAGVSRTWCPINSFAVWGPESEYFMSWKKSATCWGSDSIYQALYDKNALIIGFGEKLALTASILHYAEECEKVPYRYFKTFFGQADFGDGQDKVSKKMFVRRVDIPVRYDYSAAVNELIKNKRFRKTKLGMSFVEAFKAKDGVGILRKLIKKDPLIVLSNRQEYEAIQSKKAISFLGGSNLDLTAKSFADEYQRYLGQGCRIVPVPFNQYKQQILDPESALRVADPDYVIFIERAEDILDDYLRFPFRNGLKAKDFERQIATRVMQYVDIIKQARQVLSGVFIVANFESMMPSTLGNIDGIVEFGKTNVIAIANRYLTESLQGIDDVHILDFKSLVGMCGSYNAFGGKYWYMGRVPFTKEFSVLLNRAIIGIILALQGRTIRLIVLDLDNTLWGGVVGDEGVENIHLGGDYPGNAYKDFQFFLKALSDRGIALAICSKNNEENALEVIRKHPDMVLREDSFADYRINWEDKASNILSLSESLSLGTYSILFLDDNPVEREWVRRNVPGCLVPELPLNVSERVYFLAAYPFLQCQQITGEDLKRSKQYTKKIKAERFKRSFNKIEDFFFSLGMHIFIESYNDLNKGRIQQLIAKTNQFNTTTKRYQQGDLVRLMRQEKAEIYAIGFQDKFYEREIIGVVIILPDKERPDGYLIDSFILSCRVLGRTIETAVFGWLSSLIYKRGARNLTGLIVPTEKNKPAQSIYAQHGFKKISGRNSSFLLEALNSIKVPDYFTIHRLYKEAIYG